jgi:hypothetical protein
MRHCGKLAFVASVMTAVALLTLSSNLPQICSGR